jgi:hypothetical protein
VVADVLRARSAFVTSVEGRRRAVRRGDLVASDDPVVAGNEHRFRDVRDVVGVETVEQATQAPGEVRNVVPPSVRTCDEDGCGFEAKSAAGLSAHRRAAHEPADG